MILRQILSDILFPVRCPVCDRVLDVGAIICPECVHVLHRVEEPVCMHCGKPLDREEREYCADCSRREKSNYEKGVALWVYDQWARSSIARFKYGNRQEYAVYYARELVRAYGEVIATWDADVLIPVPVHKKRLRQRGYNQAEVLAKELGRKLGIPVVDYLVRTVKTKAQKELDHKSRQRNLQHAFALAKPYKVLYQFPKCVIIVDDIYTTGSTIEACAGALKAWGIERVYYVSLCIGQKDCFTLI